MWGIEEVYMPETVVTAKRETQGIPGSSRLVDIVGDRRLLRVAVNPNRGQGHLDGPRVVLQDLPFLGARLSSPLIDSASTNCSTRLSSRTCCEQ
jgi:hypothetical protein